MPMERAGGGCLRVTVSVFAVFYWVLAFAHIFLGLWMILDPKRNYILDLVHFSENDPLLKASAYIALFVGSAQLLVGFVGLCGAVNRSRFLLIVFTLFLVLTFLADVSMGTLSLLYKDKFSDDYMRVYLQNLTHNRYSRDRWVLPLLDTIQFYENCCGSLGPSDFIGSRWSESVHVDTFEEESPLFPTTCCTQINGASALNPLARSFARCQQVGANKQWRHPTHECCGGESPLDYKDSFWYITNNLRGTRSFVPPSCCKQAQIGRAWRPVPIDPMCTTYRYDYESFNNSVNIVGCHDKLQSWFNEQIWIFVVFGFGSALAMVIGICFSICLISRIRSYFYIKDDY